MSQACAIGTEPYLIYASDKAMNTEPIPLDDALKAFIRFDNKFFSQEIAQSENEQHEDSRKRGPISLSSPDSKRRNRSNSLDSMATNRASAGDLDEVMGTEEFVDVANEPTYENRTGKFTTSPDHDTLDGPLPTLRREDALAPPSNDLVDLLTPPYDEKAESSEMEFSKMDASMDTASEKMERVSLHEDKMDVDRDQAEVITNGVNSQASGSGACTGDSDTTVKTSKPVDDGATTARSPEMQERINNSFIARAVAKTTSETTPELYSRTLMDL